MAFEKKTLTVPFDDINVACLILKNSFRLLRKVIHNVTQIRFNSTEIWVNFGSVTCTNVQHIIQSLWEYILNNYVMLGSNTSEQVTFGRWYTFLYMYKCTT